MEIHESMLKKLKLYIGPLTDENDEILTLMLTDAAYAVCGYCHVKKLTPPLETVAVNMAKRRFFEENEGLLTNLRMGEVAISYKTPIDRGSLTEEDKAILNACRRVVLR